MSKFKVMIVKKDGKPVGVRAAEINGRVIVLSLKNAATDKNWYEAMKHNIPSKYEWMAIAENIEAINKALKRVGGDLLEKYKVFWSSSEYNYGNAWVFCTRSSIGLSSSNKGSNYSDYVVRPVLASNKQKNIRH